MTKPIRTYLSQLWFIHAMVTLGLFALWGYIETNNQYILLGLALSWAGAMCGSFVRVIDALGKARSNHQSEENDTTWFN